MFPIPNSLKLFTAALALVAAVQCTSPNKPSPDKITPKDSLAWAILPFEKSIALIRF
jgi:hypothetical protein